MAPPDLLSSVGFEKNKFGAGAKELGYQIKQSSMNRLLTILAVCSLVGGFILLVVAYDIRLERKNSHRKIRHIEHHETDKLAKAHLEILGHYYADEKDARRAEVLLTQLKRQYHNFRPRFESAVMGFAHELNSDHSNTQKLTQKVLKLVKAMHAENLHYSKPLLKHLMHAGKNAGKHETSLTKELHDEIEEERSKEDDYGDDEDDIDDESAALQSLLEEFFSTFHKYEHEFSTRLRDELKKKGAVYDRFKTLHDLYTAGDQGISLEEVSRRLSHLNMMSLGVNFTHSQKILHLKADNILEALVLSPKIPYDDISKLENSWRTKKANSLHVFAQLQEMRGNATIPSCWFEGAVEGVDDDDDYDGHE